MRSALVVAVGAFAVVATLGETAAAEPFVDAPLTLPPLHFSADLGLGVGTFQNIGSTPAGTAGPAQPPSTQIGWGTNLEAAIGLPFLGELGLRLGYRFGQDGIAVGANNGAGADHFARLFDPILAEPSTRNADNLEVRLRGNVFDLKVVQLGLETRIIIPTDTTSVLAFTPGVPVRVHVLGRVRVDTGLWFPIALTQPTAGYSIDIPAQAFFQLGDAPVWVGPLTGLRFNNPFASGSSTDIPLGIGGGYTVGGVVDLKAQVRTERINDSAWASQHLGAGFGVGLRLP